MLKKAKAAARGEEVEDSVQGSDGEDVEEPETAISKDLNVGAESIASLSAKHINAEIKPRPRMEKKELVEEIEDEDDDAPILANRDLPNLQAVLDAADVVVQVLDGKDPASFKSKHIEDLVQKAGKKLLLVLNKIGKISKDYIGP